VVTLFVLKQHRCLPANVSHKRVALFADLDQFISEPSPARLPDCRRHPDPVEWLSAHGALPVWRDVHAVGRGPGAERDLLRAASLN
jgi:hypothetical protein